MIYFEESFPFFLIICPNLKGQKILHTVFTNVIRTLLFLARLSVISASVGMWTMDSLSESSQKRKNRSSQLLGSTLRRKELTPFIGKLQRIQAFFSALPVITKDIHVNNAHIV